MMVHMHKYRGTLEVKQPNNEKKVAKFVNIALLISRETLKKRKFCEGNSRKRIIFHNSPLCGSIID